MQLLPGFGGTTPGPSARSRLGVGFKRREKPEERRLRVEERSKGEGIRSKFAKFELRNIEKREDELAASIERSRERASKKKTPTKRPVAQAGGSQVRRSALLINRPQAVGRDTLGG